MQMYEYFGTFKRGEDQRAGLAREWIYDSCNLCIGRLQDSPEMLGKIADYIMKHNLC